MGAESTAQQRGGAREVRETDRMLKLRAMQQIRVLIQTVSAALGLQKNPWITLTPSFFICLMDLSCMQVRDTHDECKALTESRCLINNSCFKRRNKCSQRGWLHGRQGKMEFQKGINSLNAAKKSTKISTKKYSLDVTRR